MSTSETYEEVTLNLGSDAERIRKAANTRLLSATTGGIEGSWRLCVMAFGTVMLVIGTSSTGVALFNDSPGSTLFVLGLSLLVLGGAMVAFSCLRSHYLKGKPRNESRSMLVNETVEKKPTV